MNASEDKSPPENPSPVQRRVSVLDWLWREQAVPKEKTAVRLASFAGAWGVFSGLAVFVLIEDSFLNNPWGIVAQIAVTILAASIIEWFKEGTERPAAKGRLNWAGVISTILMLATFEVFVLAIDGLADSRNWPHLIRDIFGISGGESGEKIRAGWNFFSFVIAWTLIGALLAGVLARTITRIPVTDHVAAFGKSLSAGLKVGLIYVPMLIFGWGIAVRLVWHFWLSFSPGNSLGESISEYLIPLIFLVWLASAFLNIKALSGTSILFAGYLAFRYHLEFDDWFENLRYAFVMALQAAVVWGVPAVILGSFLPLLRQPSQFRWIWSPLALGIALIAGIIGLVQHHYWLISAGLPLLLAGVMLRRSRQVDQFWPVLAGCAALAAVNLSAVLQQASGWGIYQTFQTLVNPLPRPTGIEELEKIERLPLGKERLDALITLQANAKDPKYLVNDIDVTHPDSRPKSLSVPLDVRLEAAHQAKSQRKYLPIYLEHTIGFEKAMLGLEDRPECDCDASCRESPSHGPPEEEISYNLNRAQRFELAVMGSLTFWVTIGLLGAWRIYLHPIEPDVGIADQDSASHKTSNH